MKIIIPRTKVTASDFVSSPKTVARHYVVAGARQLRPLAPVSKLKPSKEFQLKGKVARQGFLHFQTNAFRLGKSALSNYPIRWWAMIVARAVFPEAAHGKSHSVRQNTFRKLNQEYEKSFFELHGAYGRVTVKKDHATQSFAVTIPVFIHDAEDDSFVSGLRYAALVASGMDVVQFRDWLAAHPLPNKPSSTYSVNLGEVLIAEDDIKPSDIEAFKRSKAVLRVVPRETSVFASITFTVDRAQSEYLTNSPWMEIRPMDIFGVVGAWFNSRFGRRGRPTTTAIPLSRIAPEVDPSTPARTNEDGIIIDSDGSMYYLPKYLNDIASYEAKANGALMLPNGEYGFSTIDSSGNDTRADTSNLPRSMPVFCDWANLKFAYTTADSGTLNVLDLSQSAPAGLRHAISFLEESATKDTGANFFSKFSSLATNLLNEPPVDAIDAAASVAFNVFEAQHLDEVRIYNVHEYAHLKEDEIESDILDKVKTHLSDLRSFIYTANQLEKFLLNSPANAFRLFSVLGTYEFLAQLRIFNKYGPDFKAHRRQNDKELAVYSEQGEKPDWKLESVPYVNDDRGLLPHQHKVVGMLDDLPKMAIIPVDAGGGKTSIIFYDILRWKKRFPDQLPLVLCPEHLVAQYVKEFQYFTKSKVNVIAITNYTRHQHKLDRLALMLRSAPQNTVVVSDYNFVKLGAKRVAYGDQPTQLFPIVEFLRQFRFGYVACDESHMLRNDGVRSAAVSRLLSEIPYRRLASGTMVANTLQDLVSQMSLLDPSIFGSKGDFVKEYAEEFDGDKVISWKPGAEAAMKAKISEQVVIAAARRKEWAAILPTPRERFHVKLNDGRDIDLTEEQRRVYNMICLQAKDQMIEKAAENEQLAKFLKGELESVDGSGIPEVVDINALLKPYIARLERFVIAPALDELGNLELKGSDRISMKAMKAIEIIQDHLSQDLPGKVLVFSSYHASVQALYEALPMDIQAQTLVYDARKKAEHGAKFEKDPSIKVMIGVEFSMNTGLNLQFCSRLIRLESVFTPGALEQGNSRIGRPNIKNVEARPEIYYDIICVNRTIDVTKMCYLQAKTISAAKFDEADNPRFQDLEVPALFKLTMSNIFNASDFQDSMLDYFNAYAEYRRAIHAEYAEFREKNAGKMFDVDPKTGARTLRMSQLTRGENLPDSACMLRIPYMRGLDLVEAEQLGLVRYDEFMRLDTEALEQSQDDEGDDENDSEDNTDDSGASASELDDLRRERETAVDRIWAHTEFGDGLIVRVSRFRITVKLPTGQRKSVHKLAAFVNPEGKPIGSVREAIQKVVDTDGVPPDGPVNGLELDVTNAEMKRRNEALKKMEKEQELERKRQRDASALELEFTTINDFLGVKLRNYDDPSAVAIAQSFGFIFSPAYTATEIKQPKQLLDLAIVWSKAGFVMPTSHSQMLKAVWERFRNNRKASFFGMARLLDVRNFLREEFRPDPDKTAILPFPIIEGERLFVCLPKTGHPGSLAAMRTAMRKLPVLKWWEIPSGTELVFFATNKPRVSKLIRDMLEAGVNISNIEEMKAHFKTIRVARDSKKD